MGGCTSVSLPTHIDSLRRSETGLEHVGVVWLQTTPLAMSDSHFCTPGAVNGERNGQLLTPHLFSGKQRRRSCQIPLPARQEP